MYDIISGPPAQGRGGWDNIPGEETVNVLRVNLMLDGILE